MSRSNSNLPILSFDSEHVVVAECVKAIIYFPLTGLEETLLLKVQSESLAIGFPRCPESIKSFLLLLFFAFIFL